MLRIAAAAILVSVAAPAAAVTTLAFNFGGAVGNLNSVAVAKAGLTLTATAVKFNVTPGALTSLSQTKAVGQIRRTKPGIGVVGGGSVDQVDTNNPGKSAAPLREAILISGSQAFSIAGLRLSYVDADDTLTVFGVTSTGAFVDLGYGAGTTFASTIKGGLNGSALGFTFAAGNAGTATFSVAPTAYFTSYLFTTRVGGDVSFLGTKGQGYRLDRIVASVPEPTTWAMLVVGFGFVGLAARRRKATAVAA